MDGSGWILSTPTARSTAHLTCNGTGFGGTGGRQQLSISFPNRCPGNAAAQAQLSPAQRSPALHCCYPNGAAALNTRPRSKDMHLLLRRTELISDRATPSAPGCHCSRDTAKTSGYLKNRGVPGCLPAPQCHISTSSGVPHHHRAQGCKKGGSWPHPSPLSPTARPLLTQGPHFPFDIQPLNALPAPHTPTCAHTAP